MNAPPIEVDWTVDLTTGRSNSSQEFLRIVSVVAQLIKSEASSLLNGQIERTAGLVVAQLAHKYGFAPRTVAVQSVEVNPEGVLKGVFVWNDVAYQYEAAPLV